MSGLRNEEIKGGKFLNFKEGKIISAVSGQKESFTNVMGLITDLDIVDEEFKGKEYRKIILFITDDESETWKLGFPLESGYGTAFCSLAPNIDFSKPVDISGGIKEMENDKSYGMMFIKQDGKNLKWFYTKESPDVPKGVKARDRSGEFWDYSARNTFFHRMLIEEIRPAVLAAHNGGEVKEPATKPKNRKKPA